MVKQTDISIRFIIGIIIMIIVYMNCTYNNENENIFYMVILAPIFTILFGAYVYNYRKEKIRVAKVLFIIFLLISIFIIGCYCYMLALGKAFQH